MTQQAAPTNSSTTPRPIACPVDGKDDQIWAVSFIVRSDRSQADYVGPGEVVTHGGGQWPTMGAYGSLGGTPRARLAAALTPPAKPGMTGMEQLVREAAWILVAFFGAGTLLFLAVHVMAGAGFAPGRGLIIPVSLFVMTAMFAAWGLLTRFSAQRRIAREMGLWRRAMERWSRLYYCARHDLVFDPQCGESFRAEDMNGYLYSP